MCYGAEKMKKFMINIKILIILIISIVVVSGCTEEIIKEFSLIDAETHILKRVIDGDTIEIETGDKIRLLCYDFPDTDRSRINKWIDMGLNESTVLKCYNEGIEYLKTKEGKNIIITADTETADRDKYSRLLRYVEIDGIDIGTNMITSGYAVQAYSPCSKESDYINIELYVRQNKQGCLWGE